MDSTLKSKKVKVAKTSLPKDLQEIFDLMEIKPNEKEKTLIEKAYFFSKNSHDGQKRASGDPYFIHVVATAKNLARFGMDPTTISAGLLHDTIEDTSVTEDDIKNEFGPDILFLVNGVTKLGKLKYQGRERHVESLRKFFVAVAQDFRVLMIKLSDRLHNLETLQYINPEKQKRIALEALEVYAPLAHRLGIGKLKGEIEDAAFPFAFPKEYQKVEEMLEKRKDADKNRLKQMEKELPEALNKYGVKIIKLSARMKHKYSLWKKLKRYDMDIDKIYDIVALRVIVPTIEDCYQALGLIHSVWRPLPNRIKDYIALPKLNGYQSLHSTIFTGDGGIVEVQLRTPEMHGRAEYGVASHFAYKEAIEKSKTDDTHKKFIWMDQFKEFQNETADPTKYIKNLKMDFFTDRIFVFTPKGDVIDLPEGSSPIDFAYAIHTEIGNKVSQAKVNNKAAKLGTKLKMGDIVEIVTGKNSHPAVGWLDYAKTTIAKKHIRQYIDEHGGILDYIMKRFK